MMMQRSPLTPPASLSRRAPRVALIHDWLTGMRGGEKVLEHLCEMFPEAPIYTLFHFPGKVSATIESHPIHTSFLQRAPRIEHHYRRYLPLFPAAIEEFDLSGFDLVISSSHCVAKGVIAPPDAHHLCYCHTPMRYAWDQEHVYFPRRNGLGSRLRGLALTGLRAWDVSSATRVNAFVANSGFVAKRIKTYYGRDSQVVHPPVDVDFFTPAKPGKNGGSHGNSHGTGHSNGHGGQPGKPYCMMVSALAPYKRIEVAMAACERLGMDLQIVGEGPERARLEAMATPNVHFAGKVDGRRLRDLYRGASAFLQPGIEDFGIASVEALACGTPVVATARGGILDIVEDGRHGVLYPDYLGPADVAEAIDKVLRMGFNSLDLRKRAESFAAPRFVERIQHLLSSSSPSSSVRAALS
jgi:glycosyltransferase involved in cell wall biosynthesis